MHGNNIVEFSQVEHTLVDSKGSIVAKDRTSFSLTPDYLAVQQLKNREQLGNRPGNQ
jgi:hypothetical protein